MLPIIQHYTADHKIKQGQLLHNNYKSHNCYFQQTDEYVVVRRQMPVIMKYKVYL